MVKKWQKKLDKLDNKTSKILEDIIKDIIKWNLYWYDIKKLEWLEKIYRLRKWKIRIIFYKGETKWEILKIDFRWWIYK